MAELRGLLRISGFVAALAVAVGCSSDDDLVIPNLAGDYALTQVIAGEDQCSIGNTLNVPIRIVQGGQNAVLTEGAIPGPDVCGATSQGIVYENRLFPSTGETAFAGYFGPGCDLIQSDDWSLTIAANGQVVGAWSVSFQDAPAGCSKAPFLPCVNDYDVTGLPCEGCVPECVLAAKRSESGWPAR